MKTNWANPKINKKFGLSVYGPEKVKFTKVGDSEFKLLKLKDILYSAIFEKAKRETEGWNALSSKGVFRNVSSKFEHSTIGYGYYAFRNKSPKNLEFILTMNKKLNVVYCKEIFLIFFFSNAGEP